MAVTVLGIVLTLVGLVLSLVGAVLPVRVPLVVWGWAPPVTGFYGGTGFFGGAPEGPVLVEAVATMPKKTWWIGCGLMVVGCVLQICAPVNRLAV